MSPRAAGGPHPPAPAQPPVAAADQAPASHQPPTAADQAPAPHPGPRQAPPPPPSWPAGAADGPIRLARSEATRLQAVALLGCALTLPAALARLTPPRTPAPLASCATQAVTREGSVYCQGPGRSLPPGQALWVGLRFDLNTASAQTLALVPGIGPKLAARLVADRVERGPFRRVQDTTRVRGIGPKLSARIAAYAQVSPRDRKAAQPIGPPRPKP